ncbi:uncharacterized protein LOC116345291 [Contarinia nasturtii]|uniref:uncharacterized protein LOC116345291 n=1 Tax=Contarinia nasturtii TaxID=265458 RepID=UPI0012D4482B|nr:uncharacterized protein LOC116345291 [Contarinia nasturtii]
MADLSMVKKIIISLMNLHPNGVAADKLDKQYKYQEGHLIPFADYSYLSLCSFLQEELGNNIKIVQEGFETMLYPIATANSAHVMKLISHQNNQNTRRPTQRRYNTPSSSFQENSTTYNGHCSNQAEESNYHRRTQPNGSQNRSPTMPRLVEYRPLRNGRTNEQYNQMLQEKLLQSEYAHLSRESQSHYNEQTSDRRSMYKHKVQRLDEYRPFRNSRTSEQYNQMLQTKLLQSQDAHLPRGSQSHYNEQTSSDASAFNDRRSMYNDKLQRLVAKAHDRQERSTVKNNIYTCVPQPHTSAMSLNYKSLSNNLPTMSSAQKPSNRPKEEVVWDSSTENIGKENEWDDYVEKAKPPTVNKASSDDYCGVSDIDNSPPSETSEEVMRKKMAHCWFSDSEEEDYTDIKNISSEIHAGDTLPVRISDVNNPLKFWVHVRLPKYKDDINNLYKEMDEFYKLNRHSDEYKVTDPDEQGKLYFAAYYKDQWHRVEAIDAQMGESQKVSFIDHGTRDTINISDMRQLPKKFWKCPKAALCCALGNIKPKGKTFDSASAKALIQMVDNEKKMYAKVLDVDYAKFKATIELVLGSDKRCVNDELVQLGHAIKKTIRANA